MNKEDYIRISSERLNNNSKQIMLNQIEQYYKSKEYKLPEHNYNIGDDVFLKKGTLLHGTYKNIDGLKEIVKDGLISSWFVTEARGSKYPSSVGVWNLKQDYLLKDYINFYSGGIISYFNQLDGKKENEIVEFNNMDKILDKILSKDYLVWSMGQTKEARFLPSLVQNHVQIGIIFDGNSTYMNELKKYDILEYDNVNDIDVKPFVNENYYETFIVDRKNKDEIFTDRESAILFGIPSNFIEGILVGRTYEKDESILKEIKDLLPNAYICNLDGKVIVK